MAAPERIRNSQLLRLYTGNTNNWQPAPITDEAERQKVLAFMAGREELPY